MLLFFLLSAAAPLFGLDLPGGLSNTATDLIGIFTGTLVRAILICCLAGCGIAYAFNKDNEKMKRNIIAIAVGIIIIIGAAAIVDAVTAASK